MTTPAIVVDHLRKDYRVHHRAAGIGAAFRSLWSRPYDTAKAVEDISFSIGEGECVGFLGPNGAGKTTTLKTLSGLLYPTSGTVRVCGFTPTERRRDFLTSVTLITGQKQQLMWELPPADTFALNGAIYDVPPKQLAETVDELVTLLDLATVIRKPTRQLSLGERMKCEIAAALLHRPRVLFLDEPTIGLDVTMQTAVREFIRNYNRKYNATVVLTSHYMDDIVSLCPRVIIIDHGRIIFDGRVEELIRATRPEKRLVLRFSREVTVADVESFGIVVSHEGLTATVRVPQASLQSAVSGALSRLPIVDFSVEDARLEEVLSELFAKNAVTV